MYLKLKLWWIDLNWNFRSLQIEIEILLEAQVKRIIFNTWKMNEMCIICKIYQWFVLVVGCDWNAWLHE